jgi:antitoxin component of MazEF toxin-antitoxin module
MKARIVKIGNSQGIRIPKLLLERSKLAEDVELEAEDNRIIARSNNPDKIGKARFAQWQGAATMNCSIRVCSVKLNGMRLSGNGN